MTTIFVTNVSADDEALPLPVYNFEPPTPKKPKPKRLKQQTDSGADEPADDEGLPLPVWNFTRECEKGGD